MRFFVFLSIILNVITNAYANIPPVDIFNSSIHGWNIKHKTKDYERYTPDQYEQIANNLIKYQNPDGGWPKNIDWLAILNPQTVRDGIYHKRLLSTVDNQNTYTQVEYLAHVYSLTMDTDIMSSAMRGIEYLLQSQDSHGAWWGWDTKSPTFNDNATTGVLELFLKIIQGDPRFSWLDNETRQNINNAFEKGIEFILSSQIIQNDKKTGWAQQYDNDTLSPTQGRKYEYPAIATQETCAIINLLMSIESPTPQIKESVNSAIDWLNRTKIYGTRLQKTTLPPDKIKNHEYPYDLVVIHDVTAKPIWARFYSLDDNKPFMSTKKGKIFYNLMQLDLASRTEYTWYGYWPQDTINKYHEWLKKHNTVNKS